MKKLIKDRIDTQPNKNDRQRLHEIEEQINMLIGSVQANPMSRETTANNERIAQLTIEKQALLKQMGLLWQTLSVRGYDQMRFDKRKDKGLHHGAGRVLDSEQK